MSKILYYKRCLISNLVSFYAKNDIFACLMSRNELMVNSFVFKKYILYNKFDLEVYMNIGFIGLGVMGSSMARNLMKHGYHVIGYTRTKSKAEALIEKA